MLQEWKVKVAVVRERGSLQLCCKWRRCLLCAARGEGERDCCDSKEKGEGGSCVPKVEVENGSCAPKIRDKNVLHK